MESSEGKWKERRCRKTAVTGERIHPLESDVTEKSTRRQSILDLSVRQITNEDFDHGGHFQKFKVLETTGEDAFAAVYGSLSSDAE